MEAKLTEYEERLTPLPQEEGMVGVFKKAVRKGRRKQGQLVWEENGQRRSRAGMTQFISCPPKYAFCLLRAQLDSISWTLIVMGGHLANACQRNESWKYKPIRGHHF